MTTSFNPTWGSWNTTSINSSTITDTNTSTIGTAINNSGKTATEISVTVVYDGSTADAGAVIYVLRDVNGTDFETTDSNPMSILMAYDTGSTKYRVFALQSAFVSKFKVAVYNPSGASVVATVNYRQCTTDSA